jgi:hypothetical protein
VRPLISLAHAAGNQVPRLVRAVRTRLVPVCAGPSAVQQRNTAAQYSNEADQHRPKTPTNGRRRAETTSIDRRVRSSGRRGRGFKSRHPDAAQDPF